MQRGQPPSPPQNCEGFSDVGTPVMLMERASDFSFLHLPLHPFQSSPLEYTPASSTDRLSPSWSHSTMRDERILPRIFLAEGDGPCSCHKTLWDEDFPAEWLLGWETCFLHILRTVLPLLMPEFEKIHQRYCQLKTQWEAAYMISFTIIFSISRAAPISLSNLTGQSLPLPVFLSLSLRVQNKEF